MTPETIFITKHFRTRLLERCGIVLAEDEERLMIEGCVAGIASDPQQPGEDRIVFDVFLHHKQIRFSVVYNPSINCLVTAVKKIGKAKNYWMRKSKKHKRALNNRIDKGFFDSPQHRKRVLRDGVPIRPRGTR